MQLLQNQKQGENNSIKNNDIIKPIKNKNNLTDYFL